MINGKRFLLALVLAGTGPALASEWTGSESEDWFDAANWTAGVPTAGTNQVRLNTNTPNPTEIDGKAAETGSSFGVGHVGIGELTIVNGGTLSSASATLGSQLAGNGSVAISGAGSSWQIASGNFDVGSAGSGQIEIRDGGLLQTNFSSVSRLALQASSSGSMTVAGPGSHWELQGNFQVGSLGTGQMNIIDGGQVTFSGTSRLAQASNSSGEMTIAGAGSTLSGARLHVGNGSTSGTTLATGLMQLVDGATLELTGPGSPSNYRLIIASNSLSEGTVIIGAPPGEPPAAPGELLLTGGIGFSNGSGTLVFNHTGVLEMDFPITGPVNGTGHIQVDSGVNLFTGASLDYSGSVSIAEGATFGASGQLGTVENLGRFQVSSGSDLVTTIDDDFVHGPDATLAFEFGFGSFGLLEIGGEAQLNGGGIEMSLLPGSHVGEPLDGVYPLLVAAGGIVGDVPELAVGNPNAFNLFIDGNTLYVEVFDSLFNDRYQD